MLTFQVISVFLIVCSLLHFSKHEAWWIRIFDFIHLQLAVLIACTLVGIFFFFSYSYFNLLLITILVMLLGYQIHRIIPFTPFYKKQIVSVSEWTPDNKISILVSNVYQYNKRYDLVGDLITATHADINLLVEVDRKWSDALAKLEKDFETVISHPLPNTYGMILYSRLPVVSHQVHFLVEDEIPSIACKIKLRSGKIVEIFCTHPKPPSPSEHHRSTERDAELLLIAKRVNKNIPTLVMGDLNDVAWSYTTRLFRKISGLLDVRIGRGLFNTFHAKIPFIRFPLDHIFVSSHFSVQNIKTMPSCNSDHFPIYVELCFNNPIENASEEQPDQEDMEIAREKLHEALE